VCLPLTKRLVDILVVQVSPYMEFGNTIQYLKGHPEVDRVLLLKEIASGASLPFICLHDSALSRLATEYLHMRRIIHGDLQGVSGFFLRLLSNCLIMSMSVKCLDF
jgi:serine/threonine protein kinase